MGELVAVYGYVAVLVRPVAFFIEGGYELSRGLVAARRVVRLPARWSPSRTTGALRRARGAVGAARPGVRRRVPPGRLTALAGARPADRRPSSTGSAGTRRRRRPGAAYASTRSPLPQVRARILVADNEADLFAGTLRDVVAGRRDPGDEEVIGRAVRAAAADDIVRGLPDGLDSAVDAQGRNLSGGQRQRVRLVRALLADPEVLLAVEPTSALDAHTEAAVAARLRAARAGRTTVVTTTSPLLLDRADTVLLPGRRQGRGRRQPPRPAGAGARLPRRWWPAARTSDAEDADAA